jgi:hypothetical protein
MAEKKIQVLLNFDAGSELDAEEKERATRQLREELMGLDVDTIDFVKSGKAPAKAKAGDPITWGVLLLTFAASGGVLITLIGVVQSWLTRHNQRRISLEVNGNKIDVNDISSEDQKRLIDSWISTIQRNKS